MCDFVPVLNIRHCKTCFVRHDDACLTIYISIRKKILSVRFLGGKFTSPEESDLYKKFLFIIVIITIAESYK